MKSPKIIFYHLHFLSFLTFFSFQAIAQYPAYISLENENILPSKQTYDLFLDKKGFVWIGHDKGITKYSGYNSKYYSHPKMNSFELSNILEDDNGIIWCSNFIGQIFYVKNDSLNLLNDKPNYNFFGKSGLTYGNKHIYFVENNELNEVDINNYIITKIPFYKDLKIYSYSFNPKLGLLLYTKNGIYVYKNKIFSLVSKCYDAQKSIYLKCIDDKILGVDINKRTVYQLKNNRWQYFLTSKNSSADITTINKINNKIYCNTYNGIVIQDLKTNRTELFFKDYSFSDEIIDNQGNLWVSTLTSGVFIIPESKNIKQFLERVDNITSICLINEKNMIALGTKNGKIYLLNKSTLKIIKQINLTEIKNVENIYYNPKTNELNVSTLNHTVINLDNYSLKTIPQIHNAKSIIEYNNQYVFVNANTLSVVNTNGSDIEKAVANWPFSIEEQQSRKRIDLISNERFFKIQYFEKRKLLITSSINNIYWLSNKKIGTIKYNGNPISAKQMLIYNNTIFASQTNKGLFIITDTNKVTLMNNESLKSINNFCISGNNLILNTNYGLYSFNIKTYQITNLSKNINYPTQSLELIEGDNNYIYATDMNTIVKLSNKIIFNKSYKTPLYINKILVNNLHNNDLLNLNHTDNNITIFFDIINYKLPKEILIKYRLNSNDDWKVVNANQGFINFSLLPGQDYNIEIKLANTDGANSETVKIRIAPPYYKSWWFIVLIVILSAGVALLIMFIRIKNLKYKNRLIIEKVMLEKDLRQSLLTSIRTQMNPHFIFNALNTIHSFIYTNDKKNASDYLVKFSDLTRLVLEMSEKEAVTLKEEIKALELYLSLENVRLNEMLDYNFIIDSSIVKDYIRIPPMIIQPYVENAVKHGLLHKKGEKKLFIYFTLNKHLITITIEDNGVGRGKSKEINLIKAKSHKSFSTNANKKRIEILNLSQEGKKTGVDIVDLFDENKIPIGTRVIIEIPIVV